MKQKPFGLLNLVITRRAITFGCLKILVRRLAFITPGKKMANFLQQSMLAVFSLASNLDFS
jgi:hypothetical protein